MVKRKVTTDHNSIARQIEDNIKNPFNAFNEYIWNSIDAGSKNININIDIQSEIIKKLEIVDDGKGINYEELDTESFGKFNFSRKSIDKEITKSIPRGEKGFGRFSFIKFAVSCVWETIYTNKVNNKKFNYSIKVDESELDAYDDKKLNETTEPTGTKTTFQMYNDKRNYSLLGKNKNLDMLTENIILEFGWVIVLLDLNIKINKNKIDLKPFIDGKIHTDSFKHEKETFNLKFIKWNKQLKNQSSRYYFLDSNNNEVFVKTTKLNHKGDDFYHSLYIQSSFFDSFNSFSSSKDLKEIEDKLDSYLRRKRKPFIRKFSTRKTKEFRSKGLYPKFSEFEIAFKEPIYTKIVEEVIEFAPTLVSNSNDSQRKIFLQLIYRLLDDESSRNTLYEILEVLVDEDNQKDLEELNTTLKKYQLKNILGTIKLVEDRLKTIQRLREMIYNEDFYFIESDLQAVIEDHFWIFGEEYNLMLCSEEDDFNKMRNLYYEKVLKIGKDEYEKDFISRRQVDLFITGSTTEGTRLKRNLIIEIKKPSLDISFENYRQIEDYCRIINKDPQLNDPNRDHWDFILLCRDITSKDQKDFDDRYKDNYKGLIFDNNKNMRIFVMKWESLLREVEFRLRYLEKELEIKKSHLKPTKKIEDKSSFLDEFENKAVIEKEVIN